MAGLLIQRLGDYMGASPDYLSSNDKTKAQTRTASRSNTVRMHINSDSSRYQFCTKGEIVTLSRLAVTFLPSRVPGFMAQLPYCVWIHIAKFLPLNTLRVLFGVNHAFYELAMDLRYRVAVLHCGVSAHTPWNFVRLQSVRHLRVYSIC
jgi:hypothetical protein